MTLSIPALPSTWPYAPRGAAQALAARETALPGLNGLWRLEAPAGLALDGPGQPLGQAFGRGGVLRAGELVLRPYRRGGLMRFVNGEVYAGPGRFQREFQVHRALWAAGFPTVEPLGWACRGKLWGSQGVLLTRWAQATPWPRAWDAQVLPQLETLLEALCAWGLYAPDLNATNILVDARGGVLALDWDRAAWTGRPGLMARYRERLGRSLRKLGAPAAVLAAF